MAENNRITAFSPRQTSDSQRVLKISGSATKIATWNVRTLHEAEKFDNATHEMLRLQVDILGISEMKWTGLGRSALNKHTMYYSGGDIKHQHGVAFIVSENVNRAVKNFLLYSDRIALLQTQACPIGMT